MQTTISLFDHLGVLINYKKSHLDPTQEIENLGFVLNSVVMTTTDPSNKIKNIHTQLKKFRLGTDTTARQLSSLLGKINNLSDDCFHTGPHDGSGHGEGFPTTPRMGPRRSIVTGNVDRHHLVDRQPLFDERSESPPFDTRLVAGDGRKGLRLGSLDRDPHQIVRWTIYGDRNDVGYQLNSHLDLLRNQRLDLGIDNTTTVWYIQKYGGTRNHLSRLVTHIFEICRRTGTTLMGLYIPDVENHITDSESRKVLSNTDLQLDPRYFCTVDEIWGGHSVDLFSSRTNRQVSRYTRWKTSPGTVWTDSLCQDWNRENPWVNPPFVLLSHVTQKIRESPVSPHCRPLWKSQPWFVSLLRLSVDLPRVLPTHRSLFITRLTRPRPRQHHRGRQSCDIYPEMPPVEVTTHHMCTSEVSQTSRTSARCTAIGTSPANACLNSNSSCPN